MLFYHQQHHLVVNSLSLFEIHVFILNTPPIPIPIPIPISLILLILIPIPPFLIPYPSFCHSNSPDPSPRNATPSVRFFPPSLLYYVYIIIIIFFIYCFTIYHPPLVIDNFLKKNLYNAAYDDDDDSDDGDAGAAFDIGATVKPAALSQMDAALDALARELTKLRTGRASVGMFPFASPTISLLHISLFHFFFRNAGSHHCRR